VEHRYGASFERRHVAVFEVRHIAGVFEERRHVAGDERGVLAAAQHEGLHGATTIRSSPSRTAQIA